MTKGKHFVDLFPVLCTISKCIIGLFIMVFLCYTRVRAANTSGIIDWNSLHSYGDEDFANTMIKVSNVDGNNTLVLPSTVSAQQVVLNLNIPVDTTVSVRDKAGNSVCLAESNVLDLNTLCSNGEFSLVLEASNGKDASFYQLEVVFSDHINTMYLVSEDPVNKGRVWVESSIDKSNKATGSMIMQGEDGHVVYDGELTQIKGRGNSTWGQKKKPYQIKLEKKKDLLETGDGDNKSKTWVLLANYLDPAFVRNTIALNMGNALGIDYSVQSSYVDLYYDGEYRGCYLLTEKVEVGSGRVDITDLEETNEEVNADIDLEDLEVKRDITYNGAMYTYCEGMQSPEDISGGFLLEMEFAERAVEEISYFCTKRGNYVVVKSPEYASKEEMIYISSLYQEYEDAVYNGGMNAYTGKLYSDYVDVNSIVYCYLVNEFMVNTDGFSSSTYLYKDAGEDILHMGPLWDFDLSLGRSWGKTSSDAKSPNRLYTANVTEFISVLSKIGSFRELVKNVYDEEVYPLVEEVLLGNSNEVSSDGTLHSLEYYDHLVSCSAKCDNIIWQTGEGYNQEIAMASDFIVNRLNYLKNEFGEWSHEDYNFREITYIDVAESDWYYDGVYKITNYGIMQGVGDGKFDVNSYSTRSQVAQTLYKIEKQPNVSFSQKFLDVASDDWYSNAVIWAAENNIIKGYQDGNFKPHDSITREDLVVLLYRYLGSPDTNGSLEGFKDITSVSDYAKNALIWAIKEGIVKGHADHMIQPKSYATRAELATILVRFYEKINNY